MPTTCLPTVGRDIPRRVHQHTAHLFFCATDAVRAEVMLNVWRRILIGQPSSGWFKANQRRESNEHGACRAESVLSKVRAVQACQAETKSRKDVLFVLQNKAFPSRTEKLYSAYLNHVSLLKERKYTELIR